MASKVKRTPIRGLGADAFFASPTPLEVIPPEVAEEMVVTEEPNQLDSKPVNLQQSSPQDSKTVKLPLIKSTFYLSHEHIMQLEEFRLKLKKRGERVDKSELVRRAIDLLVKT
jgi:hypothetical protein